MKERHEWEKCYEEDDLPWDSGRPDAYLVHLISQWPKFGSRMLEVGCGTGSNAIWLAEQGFHVTALDISARAVTIARQRAESKDVDCVFLADDFLRCQLEGKSFALLFDRGCFHSMGSDEGKGSFVARAAACLEPGGLWFSLIGSSDQRSEEGKGPPRLSAAQICAFVEPSFEILRLESCLFDSRKPHLLRFWQCLMRVRAK